MRFYRDEEEEYLGIVIIGASLLGIATWLVDKYLYNRNFIKKVQSGEITEESFVRDFANNFLKKATVMVPEDQVARAYYMNSIKIIRRARTINELLRVFPNDSHLMRAKRLFREAKMKQ